jgi:sugar phosphate isomerase/epimerase
LCALLFEFWRNTAIITVPRRWAILPALVQQNEALMFKCFGAEALGVSSGSSEVIELSLSHGFKGVSLDVRDFSEQVKTHGLPKARRLLDSSRLKIGTFALPLDCEADDETYARELAQLPAFAELAKSMLCTRALVWIEPASNERPYHQNFAFHCQRLAEVAGKLAPAGIRLGVGIRAAADLRTGRAFQFVHAYDALAMLLGMVQAPNVGTIVDAWDLVASGGSLETLSKLTADKIVAVQLADASAEAVEQGWPSTSRLLPGETGLIDTAAMLTWLAKLGYDGPITPVPSPASLSGMRREAVAKKAGEQLDKIWKAAGLTPAGKLAPIAPAPVAQPAPAAKQAPAPKPAPVSKPASRATSKRW